jgi:hypothetical protein
MQQTSQPALDGSQHADRCVVSGKANPRRTSTRLEIEGGVMRNAEELGEGDEEIAFED